MVTEEGKEKDGAVPLAIGPVLSNPEYKPGTDLEKKARIEKVVLISVIVLLVAVAGFFLYRLWKKTVHSGDAG